MGLDAFFLRRQEAGLVKDVNAGRFRRGDMPMLPDHSVLWGVHGLPDGLGDLLLPHQYRPTVVTLLAREVFKTQELKPPSVLHGSYGFVEFSGRLAVKTAKMVYSWAPDHMGLPGLQANIVVGTGLVRMGSAACIGSQKVSAPEQLGALMRPDEAGKPVWVMTRKHGTAGNKGSLWLLPSAPVREYLLHKAIRACGGDIDTIELNDTPQNYLINDATGDLVRLDVYAVGRQEACIVPGTEELLAARYVGMTPPDSWGQQDHIRIPW